MEERDDFGVRSRPVSRTRCFGVLGVYVARASLNRTVDGVETVEGGTFSSEIGCSMGRVVLVLVFTSSS